MTQATVTTPGVGAFSPTLSTAAILRQRLADSPDSTIFERKAALGGQFVPVTVREFAEEVLSAARGLIALGVEPGDRVAVMSRTRYEWTLLSFAIWSVGAVVVPIYETSSADQAEWILSDAGVTVAFAESRPTASVLEPLREQVTSLQRVLVIEEDAFTELAQGGESVDRDEVRRRSDALDVDSLALVIYTSGTTGRPKGVELTHGNITSVVVHGADDPNFSIVVKGEDKRTLLFLPLAHVFAQFIQVLCVYAGCAMGHVPDTRNLVQDLQAFKPTFILGVPRVFEKVYNAADAKAGAGARQKIFRWGARVAISYSRALDTADGPTAVLKAQRALADRLVYRKLLSAMGGDLQYAVSGGAPLGERLGHFFRGIGIVVLEGYGLTETSAPTSVNRPGLVKIGTVGPPYPGTSLAIADDGQVMVKGPHVFRGYRNNPEATAEAFVDGWFVTGDLGSLDDDGYLRITGRKKELIVTAGGKNVAPAVLEDRLRGHPLVSQVVVVGDGKPFIGALVTLDADMLPAWLTNHKLPPLTVEEAASHPRVLEALDRAVARANQAVSRAESIRKLKVLTVDFTEQNGYLTPSLKVRRSAVLQDFADDIESLYEH